MMGKLWDNKALFLLSPVTAPNEEVFEDSADYDSVRLLLEPLTEGERSNRLKKGPQETRDGPRNDGSKAIDDNNFYHYADEVCGFTEDELANLEEIEKKVELTITINNPPQY